MNNKYIIVDINSKSFIQCYTEGDTIFLSKKIDNAETWNNAEDAKECASRWATVARRYLADEDESEIYNVQLVPYKVKCKYTFENVE